MPGTITHRTRLRPPKFLNRVEVVEIDPTSKEVKKVRFVDRKEVIESGGEKVGPRFVE